MVFNAKRDLLLIVTLCFMLLSTGNEQVIAAEVLDGRQYGILDDQIIDDFIRGEIEQGFPGAALIVVRAGQVVKRTAYGYKLKYDENGTVIDQPQAMTLDTMFDLASLTKMYATNYALMQLVSQGKINVNETITKYIPQYTGCNPAHECREARLVRDLLTHTAGYASSVYFYNPNRVPADFFSQDKNRTQEIIATKVPFERPRGDDQLPLYSDIDYMLLGMVVEHVSGMSIDDYVRVNIYEPLGLTHTSFNPLDNLAYSVLGYAATELNGNTRNHTIDFPNVRTRVLRGQVHDEKSFYSMDGRSGHAGLFSNLHDMAVLTQLMLNNGTHGTNQFWNRTVQDLFLTPYARDPSYGLGWRLNQNQSLSWFGLHASREAYGHTGWTGTCTVIDPKCSIAIVLLTNKRHTRIVNGVFEGEKYATGNYGKIMTLVYESMQLHEQQCCQTVPTNSASHKFINYVLAFFVLCISVVLYGHFQSHQY